MVIRPLNDRSIAGYGMIEDLRARPALVLQVVLPRKIYHQGESSLLYFVVIFLAAGLVFGAMFIILVEFAVLSPISRLSLSLARLGEAGDLGERVQVTGKDEIANLSVAINSTLEALENSQRVETEKEALLVAEKRLLEMIANAEPLSDVLEFLAALIEDQSIGSLCSILLLDEDRKTLHHGAAPSLPKDYVRGRWFAYRTKRRVLWHRCIFCKTGHSLGHRDRPLMDRLSRFSATPRSTRLLVSPCSFRQRICLRHNCRLLCRTADPFPS